MTQVLEEGQILIRGENGAESIVDFPFRYPDGPGRFMNDLLKKHLIEIVEEYSDEETPRPSPSTINKRLAPRK